MEFVRSISVNMKDKEFLERLELKFVTPPPVCPYHLKLFMPSCIGCQYVLKYKPHQTKRTSPLAVQKPKTPDHNGSPLRIVMR
jgi:hypothetical protein